MIPYSAAIERIALSENKLCSQHTNNTLHIWDIQTRRHLHHFMAPEGVITGLFWYGPYILFTCGRNLCCYDSNVREHHHHLFFFFFLNT